MVLDNMVGNEVLMWCFFKKGDVPELNYENSVDVYIQSLLLGGESVRNKEDVRDDSENS